MASRQRPADGSGSPALSERIPFPYAEVARMDLKLHRRMFWSRLCRACRDVWPCARRLEVGAQLGPRPRRRIWWLAIPALAGMALVAAVTAGLLR